MEPRRDACAPVPPEPRDPSFIQEATNHGRYFVHNRFAFPVAISALDTGDQPLRLLADTIPPGATVRILEVWEMSGGHVYPSNHLHGLTITPARGGPPVYRGVRDQDWHEHGDDCGVQQILLVVGP
ncbi:Hypothetical protein A7982_00896 [Minicystis rosea]|nr:Hypothetical protein A7982_00896 [Minicystis rosea]